MDDIIVRVTRTLACTARLRILSSLTQSNKTTPTALARKLGMPLTMVCTHLRRLSSAGLIKRRRSGSRCYGIAESPYGEGTLSGEIMLWLRHALRDPTKTIKDSAVGQLRNRSASDARSQLHSMIFDATTAFTNHRRLQILRRLARGDTVTGHTLTRQLSMSEAALSRHMSKLVRRGYVRVCREGRSVGYCLASEFKTPVHAKLFQIVTSTWEKE